MLSYVFEESSTEPLYEQLYKLIKNDITTGVLYPNEPLPSKRSLAKHLSISVITVENSYNQLLSEGYIYSLPRKGFYVSDYAKNSKFVNLSSLHNSEHRDALRASSRQIREAKQANEKSHTIFADFTTNANDVASFPFTTWAKINRRILSEDQETLMTNPPSNGLLELRVAISDYLKGFRGINADPDNIIIGAGTETIYQLLIQLLGYDLMYGCEDPGYEKISKILDANNVPNKRIKLDNDGIIIKELKKELVDIIHITPSHHFPTGITMPISRRYELLEWANSKRLLNNGKYSFLDTRYIVEDDYDSEFRLTGLPIPSLVSIDNNEKVIYMNTFTKSLASTIRISYMILPDHLMKEYYKRLSFYSCPVSTFEQLTLARFISEGHYEKHINRMRTLSRKKRKLILGKIKSSPLFSISEISEKQAGLHFIMKLNIDDDETFIKNALKNGIKIATISEHSFLMDYSSIPLERIEEAIERLISPNL